MSPSMEFLLEVCCLLSLVLASLRRKRRQNARPLQSSPLAGR
jgi:hypothetical protein